MSLGAKELQPAYAIVFLDSDVKKMILPTRLSDYAQAWQQPIYSRLPLNPFNDNALLPASGDLTLFCQVPGSSAVTACANCPQGFDFDRSTQALICRPLPLPVNGSCSTCQIDTTNPFYAGTCEACINSGVSALTGRCSCF